MTAEHKFELAKIFFDKLILGILIVGCVYFFNLLIERYRGRILYKQKLTDIRILSYQEMSSKIFLFYGEAHSFIRWFTEKKTSGFQYNIEGKIEVDKKINSLSKVKEEMQVAISKGVIFMHGNILDVCTDFLHSIKVLDEALTNDELWKKHFNTNSDNLIDKKVSAIMKAIIFDINRFPKLNEFAYDELGAKYIRKG